MDLNFKGKNIVITGGSTGIGATMVKTFLEEGANVYFCGRSQEKLDLALENLKDFSNVFAKQLDVTKEADFKAWIAEIGAVDVFVPNVSALSGSWEDSIEVDLLATVKNIEAVIPAMTNPNPAVTFIGSISATITDCTSAYASIKAALTQYVYSLSKEHAGKIRFNTIAPGSTLFPGGGWDGYRISAPTEFKAKEDAHPMGRLASPQEVANAVVFISSTRASYISGEVLHIDGGEIATARL
ncbi:putative oxidoreductase [Vibrio halioticoli NBRC 102217]|uniref:Putative oxidoreductase n=1 Tax=Vibrio halioticoli NBRC 102217 TaxID=1219072 RepID=V5F0K7_9VIBR|nr:SDR family oxidoreductase [Vibrio halioticoli]GAD88649.1 putative oxidoreductase [Vibrio halioticoli NBRC 102217]